MIELAAGAIALYISLLTAFKFPRFTFGAIFYSAFVFFGSRELDELNLFVFDVVSVWGWSIAPFLAVCYWVSYTEHQAQLLVWSANQDRAWAMYEARERREVEDRADLEDRQNQLWNKITELEKRC